MLPVLSAVARVPLPARLTCLDALLLPSIWSMRAELSRLGRGLPKAASLPGPPAPYFLLESSWLVPGMLFQ